MCDEKEDKNSFPLKRRSSRIRRLSSSRHTSRTEFNFIKHVKERAFASHKAAQGFNSSLVTRHSSLLKGVGDDAAVIHQSAARDMVITTDLLVEDVDFRRAWMPPRLLGYKALAVSLSDIAAMGASARYALLSIGMPEDIWRTNFVDEFYEGFFALADAQQVTLVGGDVSRTPERVVIDSIVMGEVKHGRAVMRSGASAGDHIFVTGSLGGAAAGLRLLESGERLTDRKRRTRRARNIQELLRRQLQPAPRMKWGALLGERRLATAMIDLSDGLSSDLAHLCAESRVGARLEAARIPVDPCLMPPGESDFDSLSLALNGGEDFELLFTVKPRNLKRLPTDLDGISITHIGDVTDASHNIQIIAGDFLSSLRPGGFSHFE